MSKKTSIFGSMTEDDPIIRRYCEMIGSCYTFDSRLIGPILAKLMSEVEGIKYQYKEGYYTIEKQSETKTNNKTIGTRFWTQLIVKADVNANNLNEVDIWTESIVLAMSNATKGKVNRVDKIVFGDHYCKRFGSFIYVEDFITGVIISRVFHRMTSIGKNRLKKYLNKFLQDNEYNQPPKQKNLR